MSIFNKVTLESLKKNRTRTIVTIIGVMLSAAMLCAVMTSASSFMHYIKENTIFDGGDWHGRIDNTDLISFEQVEKHESVSDAISIQELGYSKLDGASDKDRPYLYILGGNSKTSSFLPVHITSGNYPVTTEEIILPENLTRDSGVFFRIGDRITLELGDRMYEGQKMNQYNPCRFYTDGILQFNGESLEVRETRTYKVVGFYDRLGPSFENYNSPGYTAFTLADTKPTRDYEYDVYFRLENPKDFSKIMQSGSFPVAESQVEKNTDLLMFYGEAPFENFFKMLYSMVAVIVGLIMFGSISLIYNAFSISVSERTKQFGLLSSIGATKKQLRHSVFFEAFAVSAVGIPLGVLAGIGGIGVTFLLIGEKFKAMGFSSALRIHVSVSHILITVFIALITVFISAWVPSKRAAKVSAIEAIRNSEDIKVKNQNARTAKVTYKVFGLPGVLASKHYKRNKRKYRTTVISLFMSIVLFVSAFSFTDYMMESVNGGMIGSTYDLSVHYDPNLNGNIPETDLLQKIKEIETVNDAAVIRDLFVDLKIENSEITEKVLSEKNIWTNNSEKNESFVSVNAVLTFVDDDSFKKLLSENGLYEKDYMDQDHPLAVVLDQKAVYNGQTQRYEAVKYLKHNELEVKTEQHKRLNGYWFSDVMEDDNGNLVVRYLKDDGHDGGGNQKDYKCLPAEEALYDITLSVGKVLTNRPYYCNDSVSLTVIYPVSMINRILPDYDCKLNPCQFFMTSDDHRSTYKALKELTEENRISTDYIDDRAATEENLRNVVTIIRVFTYGFIVLISLIAAANVFNTISTNLNLRRREFAMLKSVGMTQKGFNRMMNYECLLYGAKALLYGLPASVCVTFLIWKSTGIGFDTSFRLPWVAIGIAACSVFAVVFATMLYSMRKIKKENLIDALKNENV